MELARGHVGKWARGHGEDTRGTDATQSRPYLLLKNEFLTTWEVACDAIAHEFVAEDAVAFGHAQCHAHEIGESDKLRGQAGKWACWQGSACDAREGTQVQGARVSLARWRGERHGRHAVPPLPEAFGRDAIAPLPD